MSKEDDNLDSLKWRLQGPSVYKPGQETVDQQAVSDVIYKASVGSQFFEHERKRDAQLTAKLEQLSHRVDILGRSDLGPSERRADHELAVLEASRDLSQTIVHFDCDAFFASVELLDHPDLAEKPFAVSGGGIVSTCNYVARKFGVRSAMAVFVARKLCPHIVMLSPRFSLYKAKSQEIKDILKDYDPDFYSFSLDEAWLNLTQYCKDHNIQDPEVAVTQIRERIYKETNVTVSAGIAANTRLAKIASNVHKPNGQFRILSTRDDIMKFMSTLPVRKVNGVGRVFERELETLGVVTCGQVYQRRSILVQCLSPTQLHFALSFYLGLGPTEVKPSSMYERKSLSSESTFPDKSEEADLKRKLRETAQQLEEECRKHEISGSVLHLKLKKSDFTILTRQRPVGRAIFKADDIYDLSLPMLKAAMPIKVRLLGLKLSGLVPLNKAAESPNVGNFFRRKRHVSEEQESSSDSKRVSLLGQKVKEEQETEKNSFTCSSQVSDPLGLDEVRDEEEKKDMMLEEESKHAATIDTYECPICGRSIPSDDLILNQHIDTCLSKQAIREAVAETL